MSPRATRIALSVAIAVVLIADLVILAGGRTTEAERDGRDERSELDTVLAELQAFVEEARGLRFVHPVDVALVSDQEFTARLQEGDDEEVIEEQEAFVGFLRALGLVEGDVDLEALFEDAVSGIVGYFDTESKELLVRGQVLTPFVKSVLVHELAHALDDQHFNLFRPDLEDDAAAAFDALVEGSASVVERKYVESRSPEERSAIEAEEDAASSSEVAEEAGAAADDEATGQGGNVEVFGKLFSFPYAVGPGFVGALADAEGVGGLNAAFLDPPVSTEQVLHPERFLAGDQPAPVEEPPAGGAVLEEGTLGELGLLLVLQTAVDGATSQRAANGWGGDRYVAWSDGGRTCVRWSLVMDSAADTRQAASGLGQWAARNPRATVRGTSPIVVTNCG